MIHPSPAIDPSNEKSCVSDKGRGLPPSTLPLSSFVSLSPPLFFSSLFFFFSFLSSPLLFSRREGRTKRVSPLSLCAQLFTSLELQLSEERKWKKSVGGGKCKQLEDQFSNRMHVRMCRMCRSEENAFFSLSVAVQSQDFRYFSNPFDFQIINFPSRSLELGEILFKRDKI